MMEIDLPFNMIWANIIAITVKKGIKTIDQEKKEVSTLSS